MKRLVALEYGSMDMESIAFSAYTATHRGQELANMGAYMANVELLTGFVNVQALGAGRGSEQLADTWVVEHHRGV